MRAVLAAMVVFAALSGLGGAESFAQGYPNRAVRIIVGFTAGGGTDTTARLIAKEMEEALGQPFLVENRAGATGNIATVYVAKSPPDGHTLLGAPGAFAVNQLLQSKAVYDPVKDFTPVILLGSSPVMVGGRASLPVRSVPELIAYAKANPGKLSYASCGVGTRQHIAGELLKAMAQVDMMHIPYKGCSQAVPDVVGGQVDVVFSTVANLAPQMKAGKITGYAVTTARRSVFVPDIPTVQESGLAGYDVDVWFGLLAPAGTAGDIVARLNSEANKSLARKDVREKMLAQSFEPVGGTPGKFAEVIGQDIRRFDKVIQNANIRSE